MMLKRWRLLLQWPWARRPRAERQVKVPDAPESRQASPGDLYGCLLGLQSEQTSVVRTAAEGAATLLQEWSTEPWTELDQRIRNQWWYSLGRGEPKAEHIISKLPEQGPARAAGLVLLASHRSGFVRELALTGLGEQDSQTAFAALTLRLSDWVEPVRSRAQMVWTERVNTLAPEILVETLPLIHRMEKRERTDKEAIRGVLQTRFQSLDCRQALISCLQRSRPATARAALAEISALQLPLASWLDPALAHGDSVIRLRAAEALLQDEPHGESPGKVPGLKHRLPSLIEDSFSPIRWRALETYRERFPEELEAVLVKLLFDRATALRQACQEQLMMDFDTDPARIYRAALANEQPPRKLAITLLGLRETGSWEDRARFEEHLDSESPRVRASAVVGLGRFSEAHELEAFFRTMDDPSPQVCRAALNVFRGTVWTMPRIGELYGQIASIAGRSSMVCLATNLAFWDSVCFLLTAAEDPDPHVQRVAISRFLKLGTEMRGGLPRPSPGQRHQIEERRQSGKIHQDVARHLELMLSSSLSS